MRSTDDLQLVRVDLKTHETEHGDDYYAINPHGYVPLLELADGTRLREGPVIAQFLADQVPDRKLAPPAGTMGRLRLQEWLTYIGTELHKQFYWLFHPAPAETQQAQREKLAKGLVPLEQHLASSVYLLGAQFTAADAYAFTVVSWCSHVSIDLQTYPRLRAYLARVAGPAEGSGSAARRGFAQGLSLTALLNHAAPLTKVSGVS